MEMKNLEKKIENGKFYCMKDIGIKTEKNRISDTYLKEKCYESGSPCMFLEYTSSEKSDRQYMLSENM